MVDKKFDWDSIKKSELVRKSKKGFFQIIFGRSFIISALFLFQILFFLWLGTLVTEYFIVAGSVSVIAFLTIVEIINHDSDMAFHLSWAILIGIFPAFGMPLYYMTRLDLNHRLEKKYMSGIMDQSLDIVPDCKRFHAELKNENARLGMLADYTFNNGGYRAYTNTDVTYYSLGEDMIDAIEEEILKAEKFIFMEFFIIYKGEVWERILKALAEKAHQGVEIRLIYDGTLDMEALPHSYPAQLKEIGIDCKMFMPLPVLLSFSYNNRDHRKICVIDGKVAFTGGVNLADEYANITHPYGHWKDVGVRLCGDAVCGMTFMFLQMWNAISGTSEYSNYLVQPADYIRDNNGYVIPYSDSPLDDEKVGRNIYIDIINRAERYVYIMTPYLIIDNETGSALKFAAARGVDVRILLPHVPDKKYAYALAITHYEELISAGIKIYEYTPGFVHAKMFVSDDVRGVVGTVNLDFRSFYLHFECGAYMENVRAIGDMKRDYLDSIEKSELITLQMAKKHHPIYRGFGVLLRVIAPFF